MFKKLILILSVFSLSNIYSMQQGIVQNGANVGLYANPKFNFDKIEFGLDVADYIGESLKIATMGSISENKLKAIYALNAFNKILIAGNELWKLNLWEALDIFSNAASGRYVGGLSELIGLVIGSIIIEFGGAAWRGDIDSLGIFKFASSLAQGAANGNLFLNAKHVIKNNKDNSIPKLNREKLIQFSWLSLNKFLPIVIYTFAKLRASHAGFGWHLFCTIGDEESKRTSTLYRYCSLAASISELLRVRRQFTKIRPINIEPNNQTAVTPQAV